MNANPVLLTHMNQTPHPLADNPNPERVEEAVLALLWLTSFPEGHDDLACRRAWKGHDWEALGRLHQKGLIGDPVGKSKSIVFTEEGAVRAGELFGKMFCGTPPAESPPEKRQPFAPSAIRLWEAIPELHREQILNNVYCSHCPDMCRIEDFTGIKESGDLILRGFCARCGNVVVRLIETSEAKSCG